MNRYDEELKLKTLYVNRYSGQKTFFFFFKNGVLFGTRKEKSRKWTFATWKNYSKISLTDDIKEMSDISEMQRDTIVSFWKYPVEYLGEKQ